jgi:putative heme utilization carrier protein HutX
MSTVADASEMKEKVRETFQKNPRAMTPFVAQQLGVTECDVVRNLPDGRSVELDASRAKDLIHAFEAIGKVHVIVNNGSVVLEAFGQFGGFSLTGPFLNVQTDSLDMHISHAKLASVFAVTKPGHMDGVETISFQFFTPEGAAAFKVFLTFGGKAPEPERQQQFESLRDAYKIAQ